MAKVKYKHEALLRPPHEKVAAMAYMSAAVILIVGSEQALVVPSVAWAGAGIFGWRAFVRFKQGRRILKYQKGLRNLPLYIMKSEQLKISYKNQFVGMGFRWTTKHAQRLYDLELTKNEHYEEQSKGYQWARAFCSNHENSTGLIRLIVKFLDSHHKLNPWPPLPDLEGRPALHAVGMLEGEKPVTQPLSTRVAHTRVQGTTRVGKTRLAELLITQDIHRGDCTIVVDPKGDGELLARMDVECRKAGRELIVFHLGYPDVSAQYNPVGSFLKITEPAGRIARQMPGEGQSLAFREFVFMVVNQLIKAMVGLGKVPSYPMIKTYCQDMNPLFIDYMAQLFIKHFGEEFYNTEVEKIKKLINLPAEERRKLNFDVKIPKVMMDRSDFGKAHYAFFQLYKEQLSEKMSATEEDTALSLMKVYQTDPSYLAKLTASLDPFLEKVTSGAVRKMIAPDFEDPDAVVFSWSQVLQSNAVVYVGLDALSDSEVAATVGNSMLTDLTSVAGRMYKFGRDHGLPEYKSTGYQPKIALHVDEFNELAGEEFIPMLNKAGGSGIQVTAYTQTAADIEARLGNKAKARQMEGNFNTLYMLRVIDKETAGLITEKHDKVTVSHLAEFSGAADNSNIEDDVHFTSSTQAREIQREVDLIRTSDLTRLPKGQAFALLDGNNLYKFRIPWLRPSKDEEISDNYRQMIANMKNKYQTADDAWYDYNEYFIPAQSIGNSEEFAQLIEDMKFIGDENGF